MSIARSSPTGESGVGTTALARLQMLVDRGEGVEEITRERRFGDAVTARDWIERQLTQADPTAEFREIVVETERWNAERNWQHAGTRRRTILVQVGRGRQDGGVVWSEPLPASPRPGARHAR